jgi:beta-glucosidase
MKYRDPKEPVEVRVADLLERMTLEEKVAQLLSIWDDKGILLDEEGRFSPEQAAAEIPHGLPPIIGSWALSVPG